MKKIFNLFLIGVFSVIPIVVIVQVVNFIRIIVTDTINLAYRFSDSYTYTALMFVFSFILLTAIGYSLTKNGYSFINKWFELIINRIPVIKSIYRITKKITDALSSSSDAKKEREVMFIEYPKEGVWVPAYVTNKENDMYVLFIPTSPNPTSGFTVIAHKDLLRKSTMTFEAATAFIVSVGVDIGDKKELELLK